MLLTFAALVLLSAIALFFANELSAYAKKILKIPGLVLFAPLVFASYIVNEFSPVFIWYLHKVQRLMAASLQYLMAYLPGPFANELFVDVFYFFIFIVLSLWLYPRFFLKYRTLRHGTVNLFAFTALWFFVLILFVTI